MKRQTVIDDAGNILFETTDIDLTTAKELLDALQKLTSWYTYKHPHERPICLHAARSAIAKATGND